MTMMGEGEQGTESNNQGVNDDLQQGNSGNTGHQNQEFSGGENQGEGRHVDGGAEVEPQHTADGAESQWYWDDGVPGTAEKPEWLQPKYKSVKEQAKAYTELQKKFGAFKGAPDEYEIKTQVGDEEVVLDAQNDPILKEFLEHAKANNVSNEYANQVVGMFQKAISQMNPDPAKEIESLGPNGQKDIGIMRNWLQSNLSESEAKAAMDMVRTAEGFRVLEKIRSIALKAPTQPSQTVNPGPAYKDVLAKIHDERYYNDENFRNKVREELKAFKGG
jgi:hypothetical protein